MIPLADAEGNLPPGVHQATWSEFRGRYCLFVRSDRRLRICEKIEQMITAARASGIVERLLFGGSFVTTAVEPNDFDVVLVFSASVDVPALQPHQLDLVDSDRARRRFKGDVFPVRNGTPRAASSVDFFQHTRLGKTVGVVEVVIE